MMCPARYILNACLTYLGVGRTFVRRQCVHLGAP